MKYPIFAFVVGGLFVEFVNVMATKPDSFEAFLLGVAIVGLTALGSLFELGWNFKS